MVGPAIRLTRKRQVDCLGCAKGPFRSYINCYQEEGVDGLVDRRLSQISYRRTPVDEVMDLTGLCRNRYESFIVTHFHRCFGSVPKRGKAPVGCWDGR